jgi:uncharacterized protein YjdB
MMRKSGWLGLLIGMLAIGACDDDTTGVLDEGELAIVLNMQPDTTSINAGDTLRLTISVDGTANDAVTFFSTNTNAATVDNTGLVTGTGEGFALIIATSVADPTAQDTSAIRVFAVSPPLALVLAPDTATIEVGAILALTATVTGTGVTGVIFRSSDESIAVVSGDGRVSGLAAGTVTIVAMAQADTTVRDSSTITVTAAITQPTAWTNSGTPAHSIVLVVRAACLAGEQRNLMTRSTCSRSRSRLG